mgnify:CR=1 FL=1
MLYVCVDGFFIHSSFILPSVFSLFLCVFLECVCVVDEVGSTHTQSHHIIAIVYDFEKDNKTSQGYLSSISVS